MKALVSSSWHHGDAAPRDRAEGGDKEPIGRRDAESEPLLHQHFPLRPTVIIILWRDHKPTWVVKKRAAADKWVAALNVMSSYFLRTHHLAMPQRAKGWTSVNNWAPVKRPRGEHVHRLEHLTAFQELFLSPPLPTLKVPTCALMNGWTLILPFEVDTLQCRRH